MDKLKFCKWFTGIMACVPSLVLALVAVFGNVRIIEATLFEEVAKWLLMDIVITAIWTLFAGVFSPLVWHTIHDKKSDNGESVELD